MFSPWNAWNVEIYKYPTTSPSTKNNKTVYKTNKESTHSYYSFSNFDQLKLV